MKPQDQYQVYKVAEAQKEFDRILVCLQTSQVKTASPSRSGFKVQVRVAWKEPSGKPGLGYFSVHTGSMSNQGHRVNNPAALMRDFAESIFRTKDWALRVGSTAPGPVSYGWTDIEKALLDKLDVAGEFAPKSKLDKLSQHAMKEMRAVVASGKDQRIKRIKTRSKARDYLYQAIMYGLESGLRDDEVRELVKQALVEHTMKS